MGDSKKTKYFNPSNYTLKDQIGDMLRYGDVRTTDDGVILKREGNKTLMMIPADNAKGHLSYNIYDDGRIEPHRNN